jgi:hypothetical protein
MAKVIGPLNSTEARGVIGGLIYNTWRGIRTVKRMTSPAQPRTQRALKIRALSIRLVRHWQTLSDLVQSQWTTYATNHPLIDWTGVPKRATGCNWFLGLNARLLDAGFTLVETPPTLPAPDPLAAFAAADGDGQSILTWTPTAGKNLLANIWFQGPHSAGRTGKLERAHLAEYVPGESGTLTLDNLLPGKYTFWGRVVSEDDGQASTWVSDTATVS